MLDPNGGCTTPEELWPIEAERQEMERQFERIIVGHYRGSSAAVGAVDIFVDPGTDGPRAIIDWLSRNTFGQSINVAKMRQGFADGRYAVPDIISNRAPLRQNEFYEIKPNSHNGRRDARQKIANFNKLINDFHLLIFMGEDYDPLPFGSFPLPNILQVGAVEYNIELRWALEGPGQLLYQVCYQIRKKVEVKEESHVAEAVLLTLLALLLFWAFKGKGANGGAMPSPTFT